jgi:hypothetical protein
MVSFMGRRTVEMGGNLNDRHRIIGPFPISADVKNVDDPNLFTYYSLFVGQIGTSSPLDSPKLLQLADSGREKYIVLRRNNKPLGIMIH